MSHHKIELTTKFRSLPIVSSGRVIACVCDVPMHATSPVDPSNRKILRMGSSCCEIILTISLPAMPAIMAQTVFFQSIFNQFSLRKSHKFFNQGSWNKRSTPNRFRYLECVQYYNLII
ncbi:unnamed protein product [Albugo candida]|uniref:Uncharacterized protein n=1 Tax=Albugo candida TaxID=65357 RepID=A0A024G0Q7_9STRA|nr:unnamed protein product [Albugo candida]|eukprot:CCI40407.1 unnamed protein product [Albugo candida]